LLERLEPYPIERLTEAGDRLAERLRVITPDVRIESRLIGGR
ncbi:cytoplasmic protein, partial [Micromonospora aurantiaca]|nr:cytoplasmic protein [Micromonospora aurantiaca]